MTDADAHYLLALALQAEGSGVEAAREKDLARQLSSRYEEAERTGRQDVPAGLERLRTDLDPPQTVRTTQAISNSAQRGQLELATFHLDRGRQLFEQEQDREALLELKRAIYLSPYEAAAHLLIGRIHLRAGRPADAVEALKISIWSEDSAPAHVVLARAYLSMKNSAAARNELQKALETRPGVQRGPAAARHDQVERLRPPDPTRKGHRKFSRYQDVRAVHDAKERRSAW